MLDSQEFEKYQCHLNVTWLGVTGQLQLKSARVLCIGAGGLASPLLSYLAGAGTGVIAIVDDDTVDPSNLVRQVLYSVDDIGLPKALIAARKLTALNPAVTVNPYLLRLDPYCAEEIFIDYDFVVDCTDNLATKLLINDVCYKLKKPFVSASARQDRGFVITFDGQAGPCYRCVFEHISATTKESCQESGVLSPLLGILGSMQAIAVILCLTHNQCHFNTLFEVSAANFAIKQYALQLNPQCPIQHGHPIAAQKFYSTEIQEITALSDVNDRPYLLIDVRSHEEHNQHHLGGRCIPLSELVVVVDGFARDSCIVLYCQSGHRSRLGCELLQSAGFRNVYNFKIDASDACS